MYGVMLAAGIEIIDTSRASCMPRWRCSTVRWARSRPVGSSNLDPISLLLAREANVFVR
jgi:cardiolipin synthase